MKEKGKKILKGLGVGALACLGMFTFAGCSMDLTEEQMEKIMYTVDNSDTFMKDTLDLLEKQNAKLNKEQGWELYTLAKTRLLVNDDHICNNLKITVEETNENGEVEISNMLMYTTSNNENIVVDIETNGHGVNFVQDGYMYDYYFDEERGTHHKYKLAEVDSESILPSEKLPYVNYLGCDQNDLISCNVLDNGNYEITFIVTFTDDPTNYLQYNLAKLEITPNAEFVSEKIVTSAKLLENAERQISYITAEGEMKITYEYNTITDADVSSMLEEAKLAQETPME